MSEWHAPGNMNAMERMQKANSGNCAKGGRDPKAFRANDTKAKAKTLKEKPKKAKKEKPKKVEGDSVSGFLIKLGIAKRSGQVTQEEVNELRAMVESGDDIDLSEAIELRRHFVAGTAPPFEEREARRKERTAEKMRVKIVELAMAQEVIQAKMSADEKRLKRERIDNTMKTKADVMAQIRRQANELAKMREEQRVVLSMAAYEGKLTKALPAQFQHAHDPSFDARQSANRHHAGSHYHTASTKAYLKGERTPGMVARHSRQAAVRNGIAFRAAATAQ